MRPPLDPALFDLDPRRLWVMHCAEGPIPKASAEAARIYLEKELRPWEVSWEGDMLGLPRALREEAAKLIGRSAEDITLTSTTSSALVTVAQAYPWREGDEVLLPLGEFPSNVWPWKALEARGASVREVPLWEGHRSGNQAWEGAPPFPGVDPEAALLAAISDRTRILSVSWVRFQDGLRLDLRRLGEGCRARGVDLVVDGIQGAGTLAPDLGGASAFATGGHKGLLSPQGQGFLWTDPAFRSRLAPLGSWLSVAQATDFSRPSTDFDRPWASDGTRLEQGVPNLVGMAALRASMALLNSAGMDALSGHIGTLQDRLLAGLAGSAWEKDALRLAGLRRAGRLGSILSLHHGGRGQEGLMDLLHRGSRSGILASVREGYLRIALHGWHGEADVDRLLEWLRA